MPNFTHCLQCGNELPPPARTGPRRKFCPGGQCARRYHNDQAVARAGRDPAAIKRRGTRARLARSETCLYCNAPLVGTRRHRFCSDSHAELYQNAQRNKGAHRTFHWLSDIDEETRTATCSRCGEGAMILSAGTKRNADGSRKWRCRAAVLTEENLHARWVADWRKRGITLTIKQFEAMLDAQQRCCAICGESFPDEGRPHVDHCHTTGQIRGLLCSECNLGLGKFGDDPARLRCAADYLELHGESHGKE